MWATSAPHGHRGGSTTIKEAIDHHHGEAKSTRRVCFALSPEPGADVIQLLKHFAYFQMCTLNLPKTDSVASMSIDSY